MYKSQIKILLPLIFAGEVIFFLPFVLARIFRPTILKVFDISNLELGTYFSLYGIVAMVSYFFGGTLADRFPSRNLIAIALWFTALGGIIMAVFPTSNLLPVLYAYWGFTTIFLFWAALIKATRELGGVDFQGRAFGFLEGGRGLIAALLGSLALFVFSWFTSVESNVSTSTQRNESFQIVILITSVITLLCGLLVWRYVPKKITEKENQTKLPAISTILKLLAKPTIWMQAIIIVCAYVGYKITDDYSLYANEVIGFDEVQSAGVGTMALWLRPVFAIMAGYFADRMDGAKVIIGCFIIMSLGGVLIFFGVFLDQVWIILLILATTLVGVYGIRGIYFAVLQEAKIPLLSTGTAVGIISVIGFTPDIFMSPLMGFLLDEFPGVTGHQYVFLLLACFSIVGLLVSIMFRRRIKT